MKSILPICFILLCNLIQAQNTFLKTYDLFINSDDQCAWLDLEKDAINLINNRLNEYTPTYRTFDLEGNPLAEKKLNYLNYDYFSTTILKEENNYMIIARSNKDSLGNNLYIYTFDLNGDSISTYSFNDKSSIYKRPTPESFIKTPTHYILTANSYSYVHPDTITTLASVWFLNYDFSVDTIIPLVRNDYTYTYGAKLGPDSNIYVYLYNNCTGQTPGCTNPTRQRSIAVFSGKKLINEFFTEKYVNELYKGRISLVTSDTSLTYGFEKTYNFVTKASIRCIDKTGILKWESFDNLNGEDINYTYINELSNGDLLALGYISAENFARAIYIKRMNENGEKLWERIIAKDLPNVTYGAEGYVWRFKEDPKGNLYVVGQLGGTTKDMLLMKVDSFGCVNQDKCNRLYVVDHKKDLYKYDQLDMKQKKWYYNVRKNDGSSLVEEVTIGNDTIMFDDKYGHRRYKDVWINNEEDTFKIRWDVAGRVGYMTRLNKNIWPDIQKDSILYDFTLKIGDKFQLPKGAGMAMVIEADSVALLDGNKRKRLTLQFKNLAYQNKYGNLIWIEGIGSPSGLLYFYDWIKQTRTSMNCYFDRDKKRWGESEDCSQPEELIHSLVNTNNKWIVDYYPFIPFPNSHDIRAYTFSEEEYTFNGMQYRRLKYWEQFSGLTKNTDSYYRESNNIVYKWVNNIEKVVYNFNLIVGDSIVNDTNISKSPIFVTKVDSVAFDDNKFRKRLTLYCQDEDVEYFWVEGIGGFPETFDVGICTISDEDKLNLRCFLENDFQVYHDHTIPDCIITNTTDLENNFEVTYYPNPTTGSVSFGGEIMIDQIRVYDLYGNHLQEVKNAKTVDLSELISGLYVIELIYNNTKHKIKIAKM